ncbi:MAG: response regulator [Candidatus Latescibacteria bacterium]|nr:response regulator [Candidatus Latescibacterota bacterium]
MQRKELTTGDVATYCHVTIPTVCNWINHRKLLAYRTPGGHYRIRREDFMAFLKHYALPVTVDFLTLERRKILVVDDEPDVVELVIDLLKSRFPAFACASAANGYEAGFTVATFKPDLLLLDLVMPHMDGFAVCRQIKASPRTSGIKILILTGHPENQNIERALACGADDYLLKPFDADVLIAKVVTLLKEDTVGEARIG